MNIFEWHDWYAWHPVGIMAGGLAWFRLVQRRRVLPALFYDAIGTCASDYREHWVYRERITT